MLPFGETVTRLRGVSVSDPYSGDTVTDWTSPDELPVPGVAVEPTTEAATQTRNAQTERRQQITTGYRLYCPPAADIAAGDRVRVRGRNHRVVGEPDDWRSPFTGWAPGLVVTLERVEG
jgi:hypothetical protein